MTGLGIKQRLSRVHFKFPTFECDILVDLHEIGGGGLLQSLLHLLFLLDFFFNSRQATSQLRRSAHEATDESCFRQVTSPNSLHESCCPLLFNIS
jgi:hypothetical protein